MRQLHFHFAYIVLASISCQQSGYSRVTNLVMHCWRASYAVRALACRFKLCQLLTLHEPACEQDEAIAHHGRFLSFTCSTLNCKTMYVHPLSWMLEFLSTCAYRMLDFFQHTVLCCVHLYPWSHAWLPNSLLSPDIVSAVVTSMSRQQRKAIALLKFVKWY